MIRDEVLVKYFIGEATELEIQEVESFKKSSPKEFEVLKQVWTNKEQIKLRSFNTSKAWKKVASATLNKDTRRRKLYTYRVAIAASFALLISASIWFWNANYQNSWERYTTTDGPIILADGTKVWLNEEATLEATQKFNGDKRQVRLNGEAFFEVAKRTKQPFIIDNGSLEIEVLGTSFNVRSDRVTVATGKVEVRTSTGNDSIILEPGQAAGLEGQKLVNIAFNPNFQAWRTGIFKFENIAIQTVLDDLNRYYNSPLQLINGNSDCHVTIDFNQDDLTTVKEALELICEIELK